MANTFRLQVITPERAFMDQQIEMLVFQAPDGEMALMAGHTPMIASVEVGEIRFLTDGQWKRFATSEGTVMVDPKGVVMLSDTAEWPEEIDIRRARRQQEEAMEKLRQQKSMQEYHAARSMLSRAMVRLRVSGQKADS